MQRIVMFDKPIDRTKIDTGPQRTEMKPRGFWYSCGLDWIEWVQSNNPGWMGSYFYEVKIDLRKMLRIRTRRALAEFNEEYGVVYAGEFRNIDWKRVAGSYDGVEICPHQGKARRDSAYSWYWSWDVASGCIWNPDALRGYREIEVDLER